jgi:hypothetical protein
LAKEQSAKNAGGGKEAMDARKGAGMADAMAEAQLKREEVKKKRAEKDGKK